MNLFDSDKSIYESGQKAPISLQIYSRLREGKSKMELKSVVDEKLLIFSFYPLYHSDSSMTCSHRKRRSYQMSSSKFWMFLASNTD